MYPCSVHAIQADALFASAVQRSDELSFRQIRRAVTVALNTYGGAGCAGRVAQEFGDHPDTAAARMRWAHAAVAVLDGPVPDDQPRGRHNHDQYRLRDLEQRSRLVS